MSEKKNGETAAAAIDRNQGGNGGDPPAKVSAAGGPRIAGQNTMDVLDEQKAKHRGGRRGGREG